jgi:hypothetical protein
MRAGSIFAVLLDTSRETRQFVDKGPQMKLVRGVDEMHAGWRHKRELAILTDRIIRREKPGSDRR